MFHEGNIKSLKQQKLNSFAVICLAFFLSAKSSALSRFLSAWMNQREVLNCFWILHFVLYLSAFSDFFENHTHNIGLLTLQPGRAFMCFNHSSSQLLVWANQEENSSIWSTARIYMYLYKSPKDKSPYFSKSAVHYNVWPRVLFFTLVVFFYCISTAWWMTAVLCSLMPEISTIPRRSSEVRSTGLNPFLSLCSGVTTPHCSLLTLQSMRDNAECVVLCLFGDGHNVSAH